MKVSLINLNLIAEDAIGACIISQVRFFGRRGDDARVYVLHPPHNAPADVEALTSVVKLEELIERQHEHFRLSDLYIYHYPGRYTLMESIRGIDRGTVIFYYHNVTPPDLWGSDIGRDQLDQDREGSALIHYADACITDSPFNKQDLSDRLGYAPEQIYVLPLAVELKQFTPGDRDPELVRQYRPKGQRVLLFVGRMAGNKRIDLLIEALAKVKARLSDTRLLLVGDNQSNPAFRPVVADARARAADLGIARDVIWTGRVDDLVPYYHLADVCVTASLHEGFGVPLIEAMACGVPVVASRAGAMPWVLGDAGLLCEPGDAGDLAEKVLTVLKEDDLRQKIVARGLERAQTFSQEQYETQLDQVLEKIVTRVSSDALPELPVAASVPQRQPPQNTFRSNLILETLANEMQQHGDIAMRDYEVRSITPLVGPLIVWLRRNLTSHLREPYLDPIIERQVVFNRQVSGWIGRVTDSWLAAIQRQAELEDRVQALEAQVEALVRCLDDREPKEEH
jgi:glycosyltransferase involved in cell wall biosynthesis